MNLLQHKLSEHTVETGECLQWDNESYDNEMWWFLQDERYLKFPKVRHSSSREVTESQLCPIESVRSDEDTVATFQLAWHLDVSKSRPA